MVAKSLSVNWPAFTVMSPVVVGAPFAPVVLIRVPKPDNRAVPATVTLIFPPAAPVALAARLLKVDAPAIVSVLTLTLISPPRALPLLTEFRVAFESRSSDAAETLIRPPTPLAALEPVVLTS